MIYREHWLVGTKIACRVGLGLRQGRLDPGVQLHGSTGRYGATASVGRLAGLDVEA